MKLWLEESESVSVAVLVKFTETLAVFSGCQLWVPSSFLLVRCIKVSTAVGNFRARVGTRTPVRSRMQNILESTAHIASISFSALV
jgi:hypothetical protein